MPYICNCVFHSIRFKVNKGSGHSGDPFFLKTGIYLLKLNRRISKTLKYVRELHIFEKRFGGLQKSPYFCTCVFHSIRFKVNKGLGHSGDPFCSSSTNVF